MHSNYHVFQANDHYSLGFQMGEAFSSQLYESLQEQENWAAKVDLAMKALVESQRLFPQYVAELKGYAAGAKADFRDLWTLNLEDDVEMVNDAHCTAVIVNDGKLVGHNEDAFDEGQADTVCIVRKELPGITTLEVYYYDTLGGVAVSINSRGILNSINSMTVSNSQMNGIPKVMMARKFTDTSNPAAEFELFRDIERMSGFNHNLVSAKDFRIWNCEFSADRALLHEPKTPYAHTNHFLDDVTVNAENNIDDTWTRLEYAKAHIRDGMTVKGMQSFLRTTEGVVCNSSTVANWVADLENRVVYIYLEREKEKGWIEYEIDFII